MPRAPRSLVVLAAFAIALTGALAADYDADLQIARAYIDSQRYTDAANALKAVLSKDDSVAEAHFLYGEIYRVNSQLPRAKRFYLKVLELDSQHKEAAEHLWTILQAEARTGGAGVYEGVLKAGIFLPPALEALFRSYLSRGGQRRVLSLADRFVQRLDEGEVPPGFNKDASEALLLAAKVAYASKDLPLTRRYLEKARSQHGGVEGLQDLNRRVSEELKRRATPAKLEGDKLALKGRFEEAVQEYQKALDVYPDWHEIKDNLLAVHSLMEAQSLYDEALQLLEAGQTRPALEKLVLGLTKPVENVMLGPANAEILGKLTAKKKEIEDAEEARKQAEREKHARFAAAYTAGEASAKDEDWVEAAKHFREAVDIFPGDEKAMVKLDEAERRAALQRTFDQGVAAYKKRQYEAALAAFKNVKERSTGDRRLLRYLALTHFYLGHKDKAEPLADQALADSPADKQMLYVLGVIADDKARDGLGRPETAIDLFERIEEQDDGYLDVPERLSRLRWQRDRVVTLGIGLGLVIWIVIVVWYKYRPTILKNRFLGKVDSYSRREKWAALAALEDQARSYPLDRTQDLAVNTALAQAFFHTGDYQRAINWCQSALARARENPALRLLMGRIYFEARIISQDVLKFLLVVADAEPDNIELQRFIGEFCLDKQIVNEDTMPVLRNLAVAMPQHDKLRRMLIRGYVRNEDTSARALALYRVELQKDPDRVDLRYYVAQDTFKAGRTEEAIQHCEKILNLRLNHPQTHDLLRSCYEKLGKLDELARIYQGILENDPYNPAVQDSLKKILNTG